jgi:hypothetical protein
VLESEFKISKLAGSSGIENGLHSLNMLNLFLEMFVLCFCLVSIQIRSIGGIEKEKQLKVDGTAEELTDGKAEELTVEVITTVFIMRLSLSSLSGYHCLH